MLGVNGTGKRIATQMSKVGYRNFSLKVILATRLSIG